MIVASEPVVVAPWTGGPAIRYHDEVWSAWLHGSVAAIHNAVSRNSASHGVTLSSGGALNDPLGLTLAPNGDILTMNGNNGFIVETTPGGVQVARKLIDSTGSPPGAGALFGLAVTPGGHGVYFVDDASNTLNLLH